VVICVDYKSFGGTNRWFCSTFIATDVGDSTMPALLAPIYDEICSSMNIKAVERT